MRPQPSLFTAAAVPNKSRAPKSLLPSPARKEDVTEAQVANLRERYQAYRRSFIDAALSAITDAERAEWNRLVLQKIKYEPARKTWLAKASWHSPLFAKPILEVIVEQTGAVAQSEAEFSPMPPLRLTNPDTMASVAAVQPPAEH
ncbi:MAG: hypothetical protein JSS20_19645 [Proteobacteria bacterium]|nr:hypothetical protein [Pseudomonadota bacterium]